MADVYFNVDFIRYDPGMDEYAYRILPGSRLPFNYKPNDLFIVDKEPLSKQKGTFSVEGKKFKLVEKKLKPDAVFRKKNQPEEDYTFTVRTVSSGGKRKTRKSRKSTKKTRKGKRKA